MVAKCLQIFFVGMITGVGYGSVYQVHQQFYTIGLVVLFFALLAIAISRRAILLLALIVGIVFGGWYISQTFLGNQFASYFDQQIDVEGEVATEPEIVERNQQLDIKLNGFEQNIRASIYLPIDAHRGDKVWVRGTATLPEDFDDFDYVGYLQRYNIYANLKKPRVIVLKPAQATWRTPFTKLRTNLLERSQSLFEPQPGGLVMGMLIGYRKGLSDEVSENFRKTGLMHVVAVSGFNMTILASACILLASYIGRKLAGVTTIFAIISFVLIAGASASVIRSAIMALLVIAAQFSGRLYNSTHGLILAAGIMVLLNPRIVVWDVGFQLSVVATLGVLYAYQLQKDRESENAWLSTARPTIGAIIATAPLVAFHFQTFSTVALLANFLLLPLVPWVMLFGALSFLPIIGSGFGFVTTWLANIMLWTTKMFAQIPHSSVNLKLNFAVVIIIYLVTFIILQIVLRKRQRRGVVVT